MGEGSRAGASDRPSQVAYTVLKTGLTAPWACFPGRATSKEHQLLFTPIPPCSQGLPLGPCPRQPQGPLSHIDQTTPRSHRLELSWPVLLVPVQTRREQTGVPLPAGPGKPAP